jgi:hypothetical protein
VESRHADRCGRRRRSIAWGGRVVNARLAGPSRHSTDVQAAGWRAALRHSQRRRRLVGRNARWCT